MGLDACYLTFLTEHLSACLKEGRAEKIYQPSRDEILINIRSREGGGRLILSCSPHSPRISITKKEIDNPPVPPTFCMVLRKHLQNGRLMRIYMPEFERAVFIEFEAKNDFFEPVTKTLILELLGRSANIILIDENKKVIDAIRKIDLAAAGGRQIIPGIIYEPILPQPGKIPFLSLCRGTIVPRLQGQIEAAKAIMDRLSGISPIIAREIVYSITGRTDIICDDLSIQAKEQIENTAIQIARRVTAGTAAPTTVTEKSGRNVDFSFIPITQYGDSCITREYPDPVSLLEAFYTEAAAKMRLEQKARDLSQMLQRTCNRIKRTTHVRRRELADSENADEYRVYGELINANLFRLKKGMSACVVENFYDNLSPIQIKLRKDKTPMQNAQFYFKKYNKAKNSVAILKSLIEKDEAELEYLDSVSYMLSDCETAAQVDEIRTELAKGGYIKPPKKSGEAHSPQSRPRKFLSPSGFTVLVGRNNTQNDLVTFKLSRKNDIWLHTKNIHSSHTLIVCEGAAVDNDTIEFAAGICAYYSKARGEKKVQVDFCAVANVKKPQGARAGMVVYDNYQTIVVSPLCPNIN